MASWNKSEWQRREFLKFVGRGSLLAAMSSLSQACGTAQKAVASKTPTALSGTLPFRPLSPSLEDKFLTAEGFKFSQLIRQGDLINERGQSFGDCNDFLAFVSLTPDSGDDGLLWVNHEYCIPTFLHRFDSTPGRTRQKVLREMSAMGGSIVHIRKTHGEWKVVKNDPLNKRITARTKIPFVSERPIAGKNHAIGMVANCGGGVTPWRTILTCEENYDTFYGEYDFEKKKRRPADSDYGWTDFFDHSPEHYGWVVEIDPFTGSARKLTSLGRFAHESATVVQAKDGRPVVYMGDDARGEFLYKFVGEGKGSLTKGILYVANVDKGKWLPLQLASQPKLQSKFKDQTEVLIRAREAARILGATPLDRPEDIEHDVMTGAVYVALSNNKDRGNHYGSLLKIEEDGRDPQSLEFKSSTFLTGGPSTGFACPDNLAFDRKGNLWVCSDISSNVIGSGPYRPFANNGLFYIPMRGPDAGKVLQVASAPVDAELTGPCFAPDGKTLFLSVQHPGENSESWEKPTSRWPIGNDKSTPRSTVVTLGGAAMEQLLAVEGIAGTTVD